VRCEAPHNTLPCCRSFLTDALSIVCVGVGEAMPVAVPRLEHAGRARLETW